MKKIFTQLMFVAAAATAFNACTKEAIENNGNLANEGKLTLTFNAQIEETRVDRDDAGKLSWEATDEIGVFFGNDKNLKATTTAEGAITGDFSVTGASQADGTLYGYYPYNTFASSSEDATEVWVSMAQGQIQSAANVFNAGKYFTMVAGPIEVVNGNIPDIQFRALASAIRFNIYDTSGLYGEENVKSVQFTTTGEAALVGGYKYNMESGEFDMTSSLNRKAAIVNLTEPFAVSSASNVYMAVMPGSHTGKVVVTTDRGAHVFNFTSSFVCEAAKVGTVKLNLGNANVEHYVLYNTFDLSIWGDDYMNGAKGYMPFPSDPGNSTDATGEEPFLYMWNSDTYQSDGSSAYGSMTQSFRLSRGVDDWTLLRVYEHPGYIKCGTGSNGYSVKTPALAGLSDEGEAIRVSFTALLRYAATDKALLVVNGDGMINGTTKQIDCQLPEHNATTAEAIAENIVERSFVIYGATSNTVIELKNEGLVESKARCNFDNIIIERVSGVAPLLVVPAINVEADSSSAVISWEAVRGAAAYQYDVVDGNGDDFTDGTVTTNSVTLEGLAQVSNYKIAIKAIPADEDTAHTASAWSEYFSFYTTSAVGDTHESGYVFFEDDFSYFDNENITATDFFTKYTDFPIWPSSNVTVAKGFPQEVIDAWEAMGYTAGNPSKDRIYANHGCLKFGRAHNTGGHTGTLKIRSNAMAEITAGASIAVKFSIDCSLPNVNDSKVLHIIATTAGVDDEKEIAVNISTVDTWKSYAVEFENVTAETTFSVATREITSKKANRVRIDNIKIEKK